MKNMIQLFLFSSLLLSSCHKYDDDDYLFTLQTPERRVDGKKVITEYTIDGADSTSYFKRHWGDFYIQFNRMKTSYNRINAYSLSTGKKVAGGLWQFDANSNKTDKFHFNISSFVDQFDYSPPTLSVKKLTKNEFILEGDVYKPNLSDSIESPVKLSVRIKLEEL
jgi:hypothetical protein